MRPKAGRAETQIRRTEIQARRNKTQIARNEIQTAFLPRIEGFQPVIVNSGAPYRRSFVASLRRNPCKNLIAQIPIFRKQYPLLWRWLSLGVFPMAPATTGQRSGRLATTIVPFAERLKRHTPS
jgi:hypothetical protein